MAARRNQRKHTREEAAPQDDGGERAVCNLFQYWRICREKACHRSRTCTGDAKACFARHVPVTPREALIWLRTACKAMNDGMSAEDASRAGDAEAARWTAFQAQLRAEDEARARVT